MQLNLHHAGQKPDWEYVQPDKRGRWQRLAARTNGIVTPANFISAAGLFITLLGLLAVLYGQILSGAAAVILGRLFDTVDGAIAALSGTKSPAGQMVDASFDKVCALAALGVFVATGILPAWVAVLIALQSLSNIVLALVARQRSRTIRPSRFGKLSMFGYWSAIVLFVAGNLLTATPHLLLEASVLELAYAVAVGSLMAGIQASIGYAYRVFHHASPRYAALTAFSRYVIIKNPASTDAHKAGERIRELRRLSGEDSDVIVKTTLPGGKDANGSLLRDLSQVLGPRTLLCIAAGDGTVNIVLNALLNQPGLSSEARQTPILPLWCGNANDLAYMLNGRPSRNPIRKVLKRGRVVQIHPLICTITLPDGNRQRYTAASYASFGASAFATWEIERTLRRQTKSPIRRFGLSRLGQEIIAAAWALMRAPTFTVTEQGKTRVIFERTHLNGSRFAKIIGLPLRLTDENFHRATIEHKHVYAVLRHLIGLVSNRELTKKTVARDAFTVHDPVWAQFDGEPVRIPAGATIEMTMAKRPFYALSTRLTS